MKAFRLSIVFFTILFMIAGAVTAAEVSKANTAPCFEQCPSCGSYNISPIGLKWTCNDCFHVWSVWPTGKSGSRTNDPDYNACPNCGCTDISSAGVNFICNGCQHMWKVWPAGKAVVKSSDRPVTDPDYNSCPNCGSTHFHSAGTWFTCDECFHMWKDWPPIVSANRPAKGQVDPGLDWCPKCFSNDIVKVGNMYSCLTCGNFWKDWDPPILSTHSAQAKSARPVMEPDFFSCPKCQSTEISHGGDMWICFSCYYTWNKWGVPMNKAAGQTTLRGKYDEAAGLLLTETKNLQESLKQCAHKFSLVKVYSGCIGASQENPALAKSEFETLQKNIAASQAFFTRLDDLIRNQKFSFKEIDYSGLEKSITAAYGYFADCMKSVQIATPSYKDGNFFKADTGMYLAEKEIGNFSAAVERLIKDFQAHE
ncbi:MAG: hypothetical protein PHW04_16840 [Candidatus Wallbacteria bacterium]|nr:hypothetical protein [Candidatus Wallbacteria bacterium]